MKKWPVKNLLLLAIGHYQKFLILPYMLAMNLLKYDIAREEQSMGFAMAALLLFYLKSPLLSFKYY